MLSSNFYKSIKKAGMVTCLLIATGLSACTFQPLYTPSANVSDVSSGLLSQIIVEEVDTRVAQQLRNHLLFLFHGGNDIVDPRYNLHLQVTSFEKRTSSHSSLRDTTAGFITVSASYTLSDASNRKRISSGNRKATANFDRTSQTFANQRAARDAENRAAIEAAEKLRHAIASDLRQ